MSGYTRRKPGREFGSMSVRDRSLDRSLDRQLGRQHLHAEQEQHHDRTYPHVGARSLERGRQSPFQQGNLIRSRSVDHEYMTREAAFMPSYPDPSRSTDDREIILDLQTNLARLTKECFSYQQELDIMKDKLSSSMNSIKTFWSPELKKERASRKEDASKLLTLKEQLSSVTLENAEHRDLIEELQEELKNYRMVHEFSNTSSLLKDHQKANREVLILRKTVDEMELRISTQKQTLIAREKSIKKLLEMLQNKGLVTSHLEENREEVEQLQRNLLDEQHRVRLLERQLEQLQRENFLMKQAEPRQTEEELTRLQAHVEAVQRQGAEHIQHIAVLREQLSAKDEQITLLQVELDTSRDRIIEKENVIKDKTKDLLNAQSEKKRTEVEVCELHDLIAIKERKVSVLQRKVENLEGLLKEKDDEFTTVKQQLNSASNGDASPGANGILHDSLVEREKQIERLKEQRDRLEQDYKEEMDTMRQVNKDQRLKIDALLNELNGKQNIILELRESASKLQTEKIQRDSQLSQFKLDLSQKSADIQELMKEIKQLRDDKELLEKQKIIRTESRTNELETELKLHEDRASHAEEEINRLKELTKEMEEEKDQKNKLIKDLQEQIKENKTKTGTLRRSKQKSAQMLEEARKRQEEVTEDISQLKNVIKQNLERIEELEEALRESVLITAQREVVMSDQEKTIQQNEKHMQNLMCQLDESIKESKERQATIDSVTRELQTKDTALKDMKAEEHKQLEELYELKQEAIVAAISEKDAHIALLELSSDSKTASTQDQVKTLSKEKDRLQSKLRELTQNRMKLLQSLDK